MWITQNTLKLAWDVVADCADGPVRRPHVDRDVEAGVGGVVAVAHLGKDNDQITQ